MTRESFVFAVSGTLFGLLVGWILGSQRPAAVVPATPPPAQAAAQLPADPPAPVLDVQRASALERQANNEPANATVRVDLGNLYFDAERFDMAASWYEAALKIEPRNVNASTDLGVAYYQQNQADRALEQFAHSLSIDPTHAKTLFNEGIVRAFGKQDLDGAAKVWDRLIAVAPTSPEAERAKEALAAMRTNHPATGGGTPTAGGGL
ncbi:MAG: hypothetical protein AMXMBFR57_01340 [Acidimicrobiia bacterium]|jgi:tetratricopeptide (TPR) repeat protein